MSHRAPIRARAYILCSLTLALSLVGSCGSDDPAVCRGPLLFGRPGPSTGLGADMCGPSCSCNGKDWTPPTYTTEDYAALRAWTLVPSYEELLENPYTGEAPPAQDTREVCAFVREPAEGTYRLQTFPTDDAATASGAKVTHTGACGLCSTLTDLAVYLSRPDLTGPVRQCGIDHLSGPKEAHIACLQALGFTLPCAQIWYYNTINTRTECGATCFSLLDAPHHAPDGTLNACLQCDEDISGPVFKSVAGRTRRNTGMASELCRPCSEVYPIEHFYE